MRRGLSQRELTRSSSTPGARGLRPSPEATAPLRCGVTLDLTGLAADPARWRLLGDDSPDAYEKAVDRLLASPRYGERMAASWLAAARFADSSGYFADQRRDMSRWRDWVIDAFNRNLPFDRFTIEQIAGDLLPDATLDQRIATGFNRNHRMNPRWAHPGGSFVGTRRPRPTTGPSGWD